MQKPDTARVGIPQTDPQYAELLHRGKLWPGLLGTQWPELTIVAGAITAHGPAHTVDTEADAATDDVDTINGLQDGKEYRFRAENSGRSVVFKHGTGNLRCIGNGDITCDDEWDYVRVVYVRLLGYAIVESLAQVAVSGHVHLAAEIPVADAGGDFTATDVEGVLAEIQADNEAHLADTTDVHPASAITNTPSGSVAATTVQGAINELATDYAAADAVHPADTSDAHPASAITFTPNGSIAATDVQAAIQEVRDEAGGGGHAIEENGTPVTARANLDFIDTDAGAGLITDDGTDTEINLNLYILKALLTTRGDMIYRNATVPARLAVGVDGRVLTSDGTDPVYETPFCEVELTNLAQGADKGIIVFPKALGAIYATCFVKFLATPTVQHSFTFYKNGSTLLAAVTVTTSGTFWTVAIGSPPTWAAGDYLSVRHDTNAQDADESSSHTDEGTRILAGMY